METITGSGSNHAVCRACLAQGLEKFFSLGESLYQQVTIANILMTCVPQLRVELGSDELPEQICADCFHKLKVAYQFQQLCLESDKRLRTELSSVEPAICTATIKRQPSTDDLLMNEEMALAEGDAKGATMDVKDLLLAPLQSCEENEMVYGNEEMDSMIMDIKIEEEEIAVSNEIEFTANPPTLHGTHLIQPKTNVENAANSMSDQKIFLTQLILKQQQNATNILNCVSANNAFLNVLQRRRSMLMKNLITMHRKQLTLFRITEDLRTQVRLCWQKERMQTFWEVDCAVNGDAFFKNNFRMSRKSFDALCQILQSLEKQDTVLRKAISLQKRVAIALYALGSSEEYRTIGNMFGVGKSTVCRILLTFCTDAWKYLRPMYMENFPLTRDKIAELVQGFQVLGFPQCMGAIDGCHIEIYPPSQDATDYYNYKGWYSTVLLALVDAKYRFIYINVGSPGRCNDSQIFEASALNQQLDQCPFLSEITEKIAGVNVPVFLVGDSAFRFSTKMMKPYPFDVTQSEKQKSFNYTISKCHRVVENAFGHVKARFRRIGKGVNNTMKNTNAVIKACCILHNFLNEKNDTINEEWMQALQDLERTRQHPQQELRESNTETSAKLIRNALATYFSARDVLGDGNGNGDGDGNDVGDGNGEAANSERGEDSGSAFGPNAEMLLSIE